MCPTKNSFWKNEFVKPIEQIVKTITNIKTKTIHWSQIIEKEIETHNKIIISGSPLGYFHDKKIYTKFQYLKTIKKPVLGICAGSQIIAEIYDEKLIPGEEIGIVKDIKILKKDPILENVDLKEIYTLHSKAFNIPKNFEIIAKTKYPAIIKNKNIYGILFHPEVRNKKIITNFINSKFN